MDVGGTRQLWRTDGTTAGTQLIFTGGQYLEDMIVAGNALYFDPNFDNSGLLYTSDGTAAGTRLFYNFGAGRDLFGIQEAGERVHVAADTKLTHEYSSRTVRT